MIFVKITANLKKYINRTEYLNIINFLVFNKENYNSRFFELFHVKHSLRNESQRFWQTAQINLPHFDSKSKWGSMSFKSLRVTATLSQITTSSYKKTRERPEKLEGRGEGYSND
jgi:hypothetical protein